MTENNGSDGPKSLYDVPGFEEALSAMLDEEKKPVIRARNAALISSGLLALSLVVTTAFVFRKPLINTFSDNAQTIDEVSPPQIDSIPQPPSVLER